MVQERLSKIVVICGPTGAGKSRIAIELAGRFKGEIINADSQQVYRGLDIGTAKPSNEERRAIPHHLIDVVSPDEHFDAAVFVSMADRAIEDVKARGRNPFVVGGTGMYLKMLIGGICQAPPRNDDIRNTLEIRIEEEGIDSLYERLRKIDPVSAKVVSRNDKKRIVRALEIFESTGITAGEFYARHRFAVKRYNALKIGVNMSREDLYGEIDSRVDRMMEKGWLEEVRSLLKKYPAGCRAFEAIGYKELISHIRHGMPLETAVSTVKRNTRHYAKRQLTWFRADREIRWFHPAQKQAMESEIDTFLHSV
jgi:tRNA dimethylallyltransferase